LSLDPGVPITPGPGVRVTATTDELNEIPVVVQLTDVEDGDEGLLLAAG
jgi:hypothetical protein